MADTRKRIKPLGIVLAVVAVILIIVGIIYLTTYVKDLPGFLPASKPTDKQLALDRCNAEGANPLNCFTDRKYTKRGIASIGLGIVCLVGAYYASGLRKQPEASTPEV
jgi:hypothetical protein